jgi:hypothetical protein
MLISMAWTGLLAVVYGGISGLGLIAIVVGAGSSKDDGVPMLIGMVYLSGGAVWCMIRTYHTWMLRKAVIAGSLRPDFAGADAHEGARWLRWEAITILFPTAACPLISGAILLVALGIRKNARQIPSLEAAGASPATVASVFADRFQPTTAWVHRQVPLA